MASEVAERQPITGSNKGLEGGAIANADGDRAVLLRVAGLTKAFDGQAVLNGVDLELREGDVVLLRGENGSGKTSLLNILTGHLEPDAGTISYLADGTPRTYSFPRRWWQELNPFDHFTPEFVAREGVGRTWQDIRLFGTATLRNNIAVGVPRQPGENPFLAVFGPVAVRTTESRLCAEADAILGRLGLAGRESSSADKISLGQSKRVAIARAVAAGARMLFLDEPLSGLDHEGASSVLALIAALIREHTMTLIIVEHVFNQPRLRPLVTTDWELADGKLAVASVAPGHTRCIGHDDTASSNDVPIGPDRPAWLPLIMAEDTQVVDERLPRGALLTRLRSRTREVCQRPVLELRKSIVYRGPRAVLGLDDAGRLRGFDFALYEGEIAILQAPNGWGKSTLLAAMLGLVRSDGEILLRDVRIDRLPTWQRVRRGLRALPSDNRFFPSLQVRDAMRLAGTCGAPDNMAAFACQPTAMLSGGERQAVAWRAMLSVSGRPEALILDEPFGGLDGTRVKMLARELLAARPSTALIMVPRSVEL